MLAFFRIIRFALQDIFRNFSLSFMTVLILVLMVLSVNTLIIIRVLTIEATQSIKSQIDVSIYFDELATETKVDEVKDFIDAFPEVTEISFISRESVLESFKLAHAESPKILESLDELGQNPFGPTLVLKTRETSDYKKIIDKLSVPEYEDIIDARTFEDTELAIHKIDTITKQIEYFSFGLTGLFAFIAFIIIFNTIRVSIYTQRMEISIKKLVGATNWYVRGPYIIEGLLFSILSISIAFGLIFMVTNLLDPYIGIVLGKQVFLTNYFKSHIIDLLLMQFGAVLLLNIVSSGLAMRKYLKV
jgi:cell division transport system permease protein